MAKGVLVRRENTGPELANEIARRLDVRPGCRGCYVARLAPQPGVEKAVRLLLD
jgi:hypothetical protein